MSTPEPADPLPALINALFGAGQQGAFFIPKPVVLGSQVLFQEAAGTTPVTADGDPVGLMLDISGRDNHASQSASAARPIYRTDGVLHWLEPDGVDDFMVTQTVAFSSYDKFILIAGCTGTPKSDPSIIASQGTSTGNYSSLFSRAGSGLNDFPATVSGGVFAGSREFFDSGSYDPLVLTAIADQQRPIVSIDVNNVASEQSTDAQASWVDSSIHLGQRNFDGAGPMDGKLYGIAWVLGNAGDNVADAQQYMAALSGVTL
jgi:hypothetical protein